MLDNKNWNDFMLKEYEEAWTYIRYTYDVSNRMMWYVLGIIFIVGTVAGKLLFVSGTQSEEGTAQSKAATFLLNPSSMTEWDSSLLGYIFLVLFLGGVVIHMYITFQRIIVDRQTKVIDGIRDYFIDQAKPEVDLIPYLYFKKMPTPKGSIDLVAQTRLALPLFINAATGTLSWTLFQRTDFGQSGEILLIYCITVLLLFIAINQILYRICAHILGHDE